MAVIKEKREEPEPLDANKSALTHKLTSLACGYFSLIGCKPIETEVRVAPGWVADVASYTYPSMTEMRYAKLLKNFFPDLSDDQSRAYQFSRMFGNPLTVLAEVKVSLSDLRRDWERKFSSSAAHLNYLVIPAKLEEEAVKKSPYEFLRSWGRIVCSDTGEKVLRTKCPGNVCHMHPGAIIDFVAEVGIRRDHFTSKASLRAALKRYRADGIIL